MLLRLQLHQFRISSHNSLKGCPPTSHHFLQLQICLEMMSFRGNSISCTEDKPATAACKVVLSYGFCRGCLLPPALAAQRQQPQQLEVLSIRHPQLPVALAVASGSSCTSVMGTMWEQCKLQTEQNSSISCTSAAMTAWSAILSALPVRTHPSQSSSRHQVANSTLRDWWQRNSSEEQEKATLLRCNWTLCHWTLVPSSSSGSSEQLGILRSETCQFCGL